ncbi:MAG: alpha/beta hydrolase [Alphaproteobacteria bacterium]|nr:alpha/beta hydrolase [Alphaproteobacteria bacterium]
MEQVKKKSPFFDQKSWKTFFLSIVEKVQNFFKPVNKDIIQLKVDYGMMPTPDNSYIRYAKYYYPIKNYHKGTILTLTGRREFIEEYKEVNLDFLNRSYKIFTFDWRGQGGSKRTLSDSEKGHIDDYSTYIKDLTQFINQIVLPDLETPLYIFAHSMGGNIALRYVLEQLITPVKGIILSAPMVDIRTAPYHPKVARALSKAMMLTGYREKYIFGDKLNGPEFEPFEENPFTHDADQFSKRRKIQMKHDQYLVRGYTFGWLEATFKSIAALHKLLENKKIDMPMLLLSPENDPVIKNEAYKDILKTFTNGQIKIYPNTRHCLLDESTETRKNIWTDIDAFLHVVNPIKN